MQHVLKREPCHKCELPVFLAERLIHGSRLYHRTCLRCARCQSQLTPGSFYETEQDGEFCCETCPDEDASSSSAATKTQTDSSSVPAAADSARDSFSNKLALFQMRSVVAAAGDERGKGLLNKSLSDEEKSKSLKRLTALYSVHSADAGLGLDFKSERGRNSFLSAQLTDETQHQVAESEEEDEEGNEDEDEQDSEDDEPPSLPTAQPPKPSLPFIGLEKPPLPVKPSELVVSQNTASTLPTHLDESLREQLDAAGGTLQDNDIAGETVSPAKDVVSPEIQAVGDRLSLVLARLKQFESNAESTDDSKNDKHVQLRHSAAVSHQHSFDDPVVPVAEIVSVEPIDQPISSIVQETTEGHSMKSELDHLQELAMRQAVDEINEEVLQQQEAAAELNPIPAQEDIEVMVPTPRKRQPKTIKEETKPTAMIRTTTLVPTATDVIEGTPSVLFEATTNATEDVKPLAITYPLDCNPFGDDDDDEDDDVKPSKRNSFNPFDSSDDEVELDKLATLKPKIQPTTSLM